MLLQMLMMVVSWSVVGFGALFRSGSGSGSCSGQFNSFYFIIPSSTVITTTTIKIV